MALVSVDDSVIVAIGTQLSAIADGVQTIIDDESNPLQPADLSPITDPVARIADMLAAPETPVEPVVE